MQIRPLTPALGAEVSGVDLGALTDADITELRTAFAEHRVLAIRDQRIDREQHKAFGRLFGELHVHPSKRHLGTKGDPEVFKVKAGAETFRANGSRWHMDVSCEENPPAGSILRLVEQPDVGGDTVFADMHAAFETLSEPIRRLLIGLDAFHDGLRDLRWYGIEPAAGQTYPRCVHPVVVAHPVTDRPTLFVNDGFTERIEGLGDLESRHLLDLLTQHVAVNPALHCRVRWEPGTVVMWDNRAVQHHAIWDYAPQVRVGERVSLVGQGPPIRYRPPSG